MGRPRHDLTGRFFGRLEVVGPESERGNRWVSVCDCGGLTVAAASDYKKGNVNSCGCYRSESSTFRSRTHGESNPKTKEYTVWLGMRQRCLDPNCRDFPRYGGRGITVCKAWFRYEKFLADMGRCPPGLTLDRIKGSKSYSKRNCRWATALTQSNNKRNNFFVSLGRERKTLADWSRDPRCKVTYAQLRARVARSFWDLETALTAPICKGKSQ